MSAPTRMLLPFIVTMLLAPLTACATTVSGKVTEGVVVDEATNKPIPNAIVVVSWIGDIGGIGHGSSVCYHVETTATDGQGRFSIPAWKKTSPYGDIAHPRAVRHAHAPGYAFVRVDNHTLYLKPFTGTREERFKYLERVFGSTGCGANDESNKNSIPFMKALYDEAKSIAQTQEEKRMLEFFLYAIEKLEFGFERAEKRHLERVGK